MAIVIKSVGPGTGNDDPTDGAADADDSGLSSTLALWSRPDTTMVLLSGIYPSALTFRMAVPLGSKKANMPLSSVLIVCSPHMTVAPWIGFCVVALITMPDSLYEFSLSPVTAVGDAAGVDVLELAAGPGDAVAPAEGVGVTDAFADGDTVEVGEAVAVAVGVAVGVAVATFCKLRASMNPLGADCVLPYCCSLLSSCKLALEMLLDMLTLTSGFTLPTVNRPESPCVDL